MKGRCILLAVLIVIVIWLLRQPSPDARKVAARVQADTGKRYSLGELDEVFK